MWIGIGTIIAALTGPVSAVAITLWWDHHRRKREQKETILQTLLATRGRYADPQYSWAIRTLPMHFHRNYDVINAYKAYMDSVRLTPSPENADVAYKESSRREGLLIHALLKALGYGQMSAEEVDQYTAVGLANRETLFENALRAMPDIANSARSSALSSHAMAAKIINNDDKEARDALDIAKPQDE